MVDGLAAERGDVQDGASPAAMVLERAAAIRASLRSPDDEDFVGCFRRDAPASMARMARPGSARRAGRSPAGGVGFNGLFGRRRRRTEEAFLGGAFLITQPRFEPSEFLPQTINLLLLLQARRAITQVVETRSLRVGFGGALLTIETQERRSQFRE